MSKSKDNKLAALWSRFSLDGWAVAIALTVALLVRAGVLKHIPW